MPAPDQTQLLLQLVAARSALNVAISMLETPHIEMPTGYEADPDACTHPQGKRHETFGGHGYCTECSAKW